MPHGSGRQRRERHGRAASRSGGESCVSCQLLLVVLVQVLQNTPDNMIRWIQNPQGVDDKTAMPNLGVTDADARDIASYLYTLK